MAAGYFDLTGDWAIEQYAAYDKLLTWKDDAGTPVDLTDYAAKLEARQFAGGPVLLTMTTDNGYIVLGDEDGTVQLTLPKAVTETLTFRNARYDLILFDPTNVPYRLLEGIITVTPGVTET